MGIHTHFGSILAFVEHNFGLGNIAPHPTMQIVMGCTAFGNLALDKTGNLYGAAGGGNHTCAAGNSYCGVIYRLAPQPDGTWKYSVVHKFNGTDGFGPTGITLGGDGNLYGTTYMGGQFNLGVAFEIAP